MKKHVLLINAILLMLLITSNKAFSINEYFRSVAASGSWSAPATWEFSTNNGLSWNPSTTLTPTTAGGNVTIQNGTNVIVTSNVSVDQLTVNTGGTITINTGVILTINDGSGTDFTAMPGSVINGPGIVQNQGASLSMNIRGGSNFNADLRINSGSSTLTDQSTPFSCNLYGNLTVDAGATLSCGPSSSYEIKVYGTVLNNGTITGGNSDLVIKGAGLNNNSSITGDLRIDTTATITGAGTFTGTQLSIGTTGNLKLLSDVTFSPGTAFTINNSGILNPNGFTLTQTSGTFTALTGSSALNSGTFKTQGTVGMNIRAGSSINVPLKISSGTTTITDQNSPFEARLYGPVTIDNGATLSAGGSSAYALRSYGNVLNNGTITGNSSVFIINSSTFINAGTVSVTNLRFDTATTFTNTGNFTSNGIVINNNGNLTVSNPLTLNHSGIFSVNTGGVFNLNSHTITLTSGTFTVMNGGTVTANGLVRTQGNVTLNLRSGSSFNAPLKVMSGTTTAYETSLPYDAVLKGDVTIDAGATLFCENSSAYSLEITGNVINNGSITGTNSTLILRGNSFINNGAASVQSIIFLSNVNLTSPGTITSGMTLEDSLTMTLNSNLNLATGTVFAIDTSSTLNLNSFTLTMSSGELETRYLSTISSNGLVRSTGTVYFDTKGSSNFNAPLHIVSGNATAGDQSTPYKGKFNGDLTIDAGASLAIGTSSSFLQEIGGNIINNGSITSNGTQEIALLPGSHTISGTGSTHVQTLIYPGSNVSVTSNHNFKSVNINAGGSMDISNRYIKFSASDPVIQNGTFNTTNSDIEYNGTTFQIISANNISYSGLKVNNASGTRIDNNITIPDTLDIILGDLNLNGKIITLLPNAVLRETDGNTVFGSAGYITITQNINAPSSYNAGGLGAIITSSSNLGSTEIRRGHITSTGIHGISGTSIKRYFDIIPANNTGLNATLDFRYDDSELSGKPEPLLKLFSSSNSGATWQFRGGNINIASNIISLSGISSFSRFTSDSARSSAAITLIPEGYYSTVTNKLSMSDTIRGYLRSASAPYAIVDSASGILDSLTFKAALQFTSAPNGNYYLHIKHRNLLETWSKTPLAYSMDSTLNYDFTTSSAKAYGNNMVQKGLKFCLYSGDVTQDGSITLADIVQVYNSSSAFNTGYVSSDVNGDRSVSLEDIVITYNNSSKFVSKRTPFNL